VGFLTRLDIALPAESAAGDADLLDAVLARHFAHGWEEGPDDLAPRRAVYLVAPEVRAAFEAELRALLPAACVSACRVEEENWAEAWKEFFTPVICGRHFLVLAPWMREERGAGRIPVVIKPKTAFGTGHHASTALCLEALSDLYERGRVRTGARFLDLGTGSGILGIAAAGLGLCGDGLDTDPEAVENALENRTGNGLAPECLRLRLGSLEAAEGAYDLIMANILAGPLTDMAPQLAAFTTGAGAKPLLVLSGILDTQADAVAAAYEGCGFPQARRLAREEWVALVFEEDATREEVRGKSLPPARSGAAPRPPETHTEAPLRSVVPPRSGRSPRAEALLRLYDAASAHFGPCRWWPGESPFEIAVGAVLTQNTAWRNVEKAVARLREAGALEPEAMNALSEEELAEMIRPSGFYRVKAARLRDLLGFLRSREGWEQCRDKAGLECLRACDLDSLRADLLAVRGIGEETADSVLLYALDMPAFVVDAYTRRIFSRHGFFPADLPYDEIREFFMDALPPDTALYNEYHALIVRTGNTFCKKTNPQCRQCPLGSFLDHDVE
jgi:endonuclease-3 related protein